MTYKLLDKFQGLFDGKPYLHRISTHGDSVALELYEDLHALGRSAKLVKRVDAGLSVLNSQNKRHGIKARRGDGAFGEIVPNVKPIADAGFAVMRGPIATIEIGIEVKILQKAMIKQIDRVISDLQKQAAQFRSRGGNPICIGIVGINRAAHAVAYEGDKVNPTDGKKHKHPIQEADEAEKRLIALAAPAYEHFIVLRYMATNESPFSFSWANKQKAELDYGAVLARISADYQKRV